MPPCSEFTQCSWHSTIRMLQQACLVSEFLGIPAGLQHIMPSSVLLRMAQGAPRSAADLLALVGDWRQNVAKSAKAQAAVTHDLVRRDAKQVGPCPVAVLSLFPYVHRSFLNISTDVLLTGTAESLRPWEGIRPSDFLSELPQTLCCPLKLTGSFCCCGRSAPG